MNKCSTFLCISALMMLSVFQYGCNISNPFDTNAKRSAAPLPGTPEYTADAFQSVISQLPDSDREYDPNAESTSEEALAALILQRDFLNMSLNEIGELNDLMAEINTLLAKALDDVRSGHKMQESVLADLNSSLKKLKERVQIVRYQEQEYGETVAAQHIYKPETATIEDMENIYLGDIRQSALSQQALQKQVQGFSTMINQQGLSLADTLTVLNNAKISNEAIKRFHLDSTATAQVASHQIDFRLENLTSRSDSLARGAVQAKKGMALAASAIAQAAIITAKKNVDPNSPEGVTLLVTTPMISAKAVELAFIQLGIDEATMQKKADKAADEAQRFKAFDAQARKKIEELQQGLAQMSALNEATRKLVSELEQPLRKEIAERMRTDADLAKLYASEQTRTDQAIANGSILLSVN